MPSEPINNPGVTPTPGTPEYGRDKPRLGAGEEGQEPKPFSLGPEAGKEAAQTISTGQPSPIEVAKESAQAQAQMTPEQLSANMQKLQSQFTQAQTDLKNPDVKGKLTDDHQQALSKLVGKMNPDMKTIAQNSKGEFTPATQNKGEGVVNFVTKWIDASQQTMGNALNYLSNTKKPELGQYLKLQYAVQRATQRGELFASIVGSSVSGIKTLMSTQLG
ncbi:MAG: hypothetical protein K940chlam9_00092 [Chlamydiae bacterium]|nr:hypothetical protein [Chlamydiota bacterium]